MKIKTHNKTIDKPLYTKTILIVTVLLLVLFAGFVIVEFSQSKKDLSSMMREEGYILLDALMASSERSILAYNELEQQLQTRLLNSAAWLEAIDYSQQITGAFLDSISKKMDLYRIHMIDGRGQVKLSNTEPHVQPQQNEPPQEYGELIEPLLNGQSESLVVGIREGRFSGEPRYVVAVRRRKGGVFIVTADAGHLIELRKELGPGRLIQEIGNRPGVEYLALQDTLGIILASEGISGMSRILTDPFLFSVFVENSKGSRITEFADQEVFEIAGPFLLEGDHVGLFRIGLNMNHYRSIVRKAKLRVTFIPLILIVVGIIGVSLMIAHQNVRLLSQSYQKVQTYSSEILQNLEDAVVAVDKTGLVTIFNQAAQKLFGVSADKSVGQNISSLDATCCPALIESLESGQPISRPLEEVVVNGDKRIISLRTSILWDDDGAIDSVILVATDLTMQQQLQEQLRRKEKLTAMGELASGVAHEIRNPINAIGMIAQRFLKEFRPRQGEEEYLELAKSVVSETRRTNEIVQRFLQYAKPQPLNFSVVDMKDLLLEIAAFYKSAADAKGVKCVSGIKKSAIVNADRDRLKQALLNILQNALDATPRNGTIRIAGEKEHKKYVVKISDTGAGIAEDNYHKIFDLYYTTKKDGTGLGLPIVYQIIQGHNGEIDFESKIGKGTTFKIKLPLEETS